MATEEQLRDLNNDVYQVDPNYKKDGKSTVTVKEGDVLKTTDKQNFIVLSTENGDYGFQGMAVAPINNGKIDYGQVTVVAAGTYPSDGTDFKSALKGMSPNGSPQDEVAMEYVRNLLRDYPDWTISQLSGYSQSAYMLKVGAHFKIPTTVFSGWFQYRSLTKEEEKFMKDNPNLFVNYRQKNDDVTIYNDFNSKWGNSDDFGTIVWIEGKSHDLGSWKFDAKGNLIIPETDYNNKAIRQQAEKQLINQFALSMKDLAALEKKLQASGSGLSSSEKLYLDASQANALVTTASRMLKLAMTNVIKVYQDAITDAEKVWSDCQSKARNVAPDLSEGEIETALSAVGATKSSIVNEPCEKFRSKINKAKKIGETFDDLASEIKTKIDQVVQQDQDLARQISTS